MHVFIKKKKKKCGFIWLNITHLRTCWMITSGVRGSMWDVVRHTKLPIAWPKRFRSFHFRTAILIWVRSFLARLAFFFLSNHHDCSKLNPVFFPFQFTLISTVAYSLACASWLFQHNKSLSITEIYITTQVSDIYGSFCAILCLFFVPFLGVLLCTLTVAVWH